MSKQSWAQRRARLAGLLGIPADEEVDEEGEAWMLDDHLWNTRALGRTPANAQEIERLRFGQRDVEGLGTVAKGQFGLVEVVRCKLDQQLYASKSIDKKLAWRAREQCFPQIERDILLRASTTDAKWVPRLLCAFQNADKLTMLMDYADGGNLWDLVEAREQPEGASARVPEPDLRWWLAQAACAIEWCHAQGFVHRDIKPHNFVFSHRTLHLRLVDFGSAARMLPARRDGVQLVPKRLCVVPCGTCDYISPEILNAHEEALVALETEEGEQTMDIHYDPSQGGYGKEVDWWSFGAMFYELAFGAAPFYAKDIRKTYTKIIDHHRNLVFPTPRIVSAQCVDLISKLLCHHESRLGRRSAREVRGHAFFKGIDWATLHEQKAPPNLQLPEFANGLPPITPTLPADDSMMRSYDGHGHDDGLSTSSTAGGGGGGEQQPFDFSALFQSTMMTPGFPSSATRSKSLNDTLGFRQPHTDTAVLTAFIGFSWGPAIDAFSHPRPPASPPPVAPVVIATPLPVRPAQAYPQSEPPPFVTPLRPGLGSLGAGMSPAPATVPRSALRRGLSDREALRQLVGCVSVSARKRVLQSGRTPRLPMLRGVAFRNSDDGTSTSGTGADDETHPMPPSPSPSPRPSSRMSGRLTMLSVSTGTGGDRSRSASTPTFGPRSPFLQSQSASHSASTTVSDRSIMSQPTPRKVSPPARHAESPPARHADISVAARPLDDVEIEDEEESLARRIDEMSARYSMLLSHMSDLEQRIAQAAIPQHL